MTPAEHATAANDSLTQSKATGAPMEMRTGYARIGLVHAVLATAAGTGADYAEAESLLTSAEAASWSPYLIDQALVHAHLAEQ